MKYHFLMYIFFVPFYSLFSYQVRVLLHKATSTEESAFKLMHKKGFKITSVTHPDISETFEGEVLNFEIKKGILWVNGRKVIAPSLKIVGSTHEPFNYEGKNYGGFFIVIQKNKHVYIINSIDLEEYVCSVLGSESWPGWPLEVNKVFAITCRSYVVAQIMEARAKKRIFDIKCTNLHQTYKGLHTFNVLQQAVNETRGIIMTHKKKPIFAMYDCCCGGIIPSKLQGVDFKAAPYLARPYACTFCKECKLYSWKVTYKVTDFEKLLEDHLQKKITIKEVKISKKDGAEIVQEMSLKTTRSWIYLTGKKIYSLCKEIKSFCFSVTKKAQEVIFEGRGYGHHLGLCQWGAWRMVKSGWDCRSILEFFYCDITFMHIEENV
jgi:stage II sporulation protein D